MQRVVILGLGGLLAAGASVRVHDPIALNSPVLRSELEDRITYCMDAYAAADGADALVICTEWNEFRSPDFEALRKALRQPLIFDGRNLFTADQMRAKQFKYYSIGRPPVI